MIEPGWPLRSPIQPPSSAAHLAAFSAISNGAHATYAYDASGDLASYTDRTSNKTTFAYGSNHYLEEILDPLGRPPIRCAYDDDGGLLSQTDADGHSITYAHDISASAERVVDRLGHNGLRIQRYGRHQAQDGRDRRVANRSRMVGCGWDRLS